VILVIFEQLGFTW